MGQRPADMMEAALRQAKASGAFPTTASTWLGENLRRGPEGVAEARRHIMEVYAAPLKAYLSKSAFRDLDDPDAVVDGFFADRLAAERFLHEWLRVGAPLRCWLIGAFRNYIREQLEQRRRWRRALKAAAKRELDGPPEAEFNRLVALEILRIALRNAEAACEREGLGEHWRLFQLRRAQGWSLSCVGREFGVDERRAAVMERTAKNKLRYALRDLAGWDAGGREQIDAEIRALAEAVRL